MADRAMARYLPLACGHHCPVEVELLYRVFGDGTQVMCERCGDFRSMRIPEEKVVPGEPLF